MKVIYAFEVLVGFAVCRVVSILARGVSKLSGDFWESPCDDPKARATIQAQKRSQGPVNKSAAERKKIWDELVRAEYEEGIYTVQDETKEAH